MRLGCFLTSPLALLLSLLPLSNGYGAEKGEDFLRCLASCQLEDGCATARFPRSQSALLDILGWDCQSHCKYTCMWKLEELLNTKSPSRRDRKHYYGKWAFKRFAGIQEPASVLFSILNGWAHFYGYFEIYHRGLGQQHKQWFLGSSVRFIFFISINAWLWSTVFHSRDIEATMVLDYISAIALLFANLNLAICRVFNLRTTQKRLLVLGGLASVFIYHTHYMLTIYFDFRWNMKLGIAAALSFSGLMGGWSLLNLARSKRPHTTIAIVAISLGLLAASFEVFDFPPVWHVLDAHSLWHACTPPVILLWYRFFLSDARYDLGIKAVNSSRGNMDRSPSKMIAHMS
jgi:hypothetical protein